MRRPSAVRVYEPTVEVHDVDRLVETDGDGDERDRRRVHDDRVEDKRSEGEGEAKRHRGHGASLPPAGTRPFRSVSV